MKLVLGIIIFLIVGFVSGIYTAYTYVTRIATNHIDTLVEQSINDISQHIDEISTLSGNDIPIQVQQWVSNYQKTIKQKIEEYKIERLEQTKEQLRTYLQDQIHTLLPR